MDIQYAQYLEDWEQAMRCGLLNGRPHADYTVKVYKRYVKWFLEEYEEVSLQAFKRALMAISVEHFAKRHKIYEAVSCFARYLTEEEVLDPAFREKIKPLRPKRHLPPKKMVVNEEQIEILLAVCSNDLEHLIVTLLSQTGLRATEASRLELEDINLERHVLTVRLAKWGKTRRVGLTPVVVESIKAYLKVRPPVGHDILMVKNNGMPMDRYGLLTRLEKLARLSGIPVSPHALRRAFVTINANKGRPLPMLQMACGHSDIATTRSYCLTTEDETVDAMKDWL